MKISKETEGGNANRSNVAKERQWSSKVQEINDVLAEAVVDLWKLRELALSEGGLVNDDIRKRAWPKLVGLHDLWEEEDTAAESSSSQPPTSSIPGPIRPGSTRPPRVPSLHAHIQRLNPPRQSEDDDNSSVTSATSTGSRSRYRMPPIVARSMDSPQIDLDVARCTWHLLTGTQRLQRLQMEHKRHKKVARLIKRKQRRLANLINYTLVKSYAITDPTDRMRYYQGYHDVACIFLSSLGGSVKTSSSKYYSLSSNMEPLAASMGLQVPAGVLLQISQSHLRDCLKSNFVNLQTCLRLTLFPLLALLDPPVHDHLVGCDMEPFFALSWVITWFSHEIRDTDLVKRIFDAFIVSHPLMPIYVSVAMVTHQLNRMEILHTECDFSLLHQALTGLPKNSSMVGWKYRPGDGYVSDDEEDDDEESMMSENMEADIFMVQSELESSIGNKVPGEAGTSVSTDLSATLDPPARVPFQELFESAVRIMQRIPPHRLHNLATRYYGKHEVFEIEQESIAFFQPSPEWAISPTAKSDWVLKQNARSRRGSSLTSRRDRRRGSSLTRDQRHGTASEYKDRSVQEEAKLAKTVLKEKAKSPAVIAAGYGKGDDESRRRRRKRRMLIIGAITVAVVAVAIGVALQQRDKRSSDSQQQYGGPSTPIRAEKTTQRVVQRETVPESTVRAVGSESRPHVSIRDSMAQAVKEPDVVKASSTKAMPKASTDNQMWDQVVGVGRGIAKISGKIDKVYHEIVEHPHGEIQAVREEETADVPSWLAIPSFMQARASSEVMKLGGRLEEACRNIEPKAREFASRVQKKSGELSRLSQRFLLRGDPDSVMVQEANLPPWLSLQSHVQHRVHNEVHRLGELLGDILKPQLAKARDAISHGKTADESAAEIRGALKTLSPLVERLNQPYGDPNKRKSDEL